LGFAFPVTPFSFLFFSFFGFFKEILSFINWSKLKNDLWMKMTFWVTLHTCRDEQSSKLMKAQLDAGQL